MTENMGSYAQPDPGPREPYAQQDPGLQDQPSGRVERVAQVSLLEPGVGLPGLGSRPSLYRPQHESLEVVPELPGRPESEPGEGGGFSLVAAQ